MLGLAERMKKVCGAWRMCLLAAWQHESWLGSRPMAHRSADLTRGAHAVVPNKPVSTISLWAPHARRCVRRSPPKHDSYLKQVVEVRIDTSH